VLHRRTTFRSISTLRKLLAMLAPP
jgi:hypothetical protein